MSDIATSHNQPEFTVSEISASLKRTVEDAYSYVRVRGEISGFKMAASGHAYLKLKDENAVLDAVCWRPTASKLSFAPEDGLEVICIGRITTYPARSNYQLVIERMEPAGEGALMALLEKRKKALAKEGLFDAERKKALPAYPEIIGVITSPTGAVIQDILHRLGERYPCKVLLWPVQVQGEQAAAQVTAAINGFNQLSAAGKIVRPDVLIVARGGGSIEDLWPFNEENVVRAVAASEIPIISAVGHETDTTLIDYAADLRAPTPTAAAELAVPVKSELLQGLANAANRMQLMVHRQLDEKRHHVVILARALPHPRKIVENYMQRLDNATERLQQAPKALLMMREHYLQRVAGGLRVGAIRNVLEKGRVAVNYASERMGRVVTYQLKGQGDSVANLSRLLESYHYKKVLQRGFAIVRDGKGTLLPSKALAQKEQALEIEFADGRLAVGGRDIPPIKHRKKQSKPENQGELF